MQVLKSNSISGLGGSVMLGLKLNLRLGAMVVALIITLNIPLNKVSAQAIPLLPQNVLSTSTDAEAIINSLVFKNASTTSEQTMFGEIPVNILRIWQINNGFSINLKKGSNHDTVLVLQHLLKTLYPDLMPQKLSKSYGPKTETAVKLLQKRFGINDTGYFGKETRTLLNDIVFQALCPSSKSLQTVTRSSEEDQILADYSFKNLTRQNSVSLDYIPPQLVKIPSSIRTIGTACLDQSVITPLEAMFRDAQSSKIYLAVTSAYRSPAMQTYLNSVDENKEKNNKNSATGASRANNASGANSSSGTKAIADPGHSEHQLGTTVDISGKSIGYQSTKTNFSKTKEGKWLANNSYKYGFIMSYPERATSTTGYIFEPWHFRYVGLPNAKDIFDQHKTIQEYLQGYTN